MREMGILINTHFILYYFVFCTIVLLFVVRLSEFCNAMNPKVSHPVNFCLPAHDPYS